MSLQLNPAKVIPGHAHARLTRFVPSLPGDMLCTVDRTTNICTVNRALYDQLPRHQQKAVFRAEGDVRAVAPANDDTVDAIESIFAAIA
ncbi:hypothetical protein [Methylobacterium sp. 285MFTsu5.1]|uniref:hypothetical protein n=1 Tax=Methylobacterium sp. 285MFTsu5.1 TaxID=1172187 RepID=UPI00037F2599|nr:hypothetical protein [Methylobacterium sp. 285MFTsu5.1]